MGHSQVNYSEIINETMSRHYNVRDEYKDNTVEENRRICRDESLGFGIAALNLTGDLNIGIMIRTASLLGAEKFFIFGRRQYDKRSTVGAHKYIDVERIGSIDGTSISKVCLENNYIPIFVEHGGCDVRELDEAMKETWTHFREDVKPLFIFGSESEGIPEDIIAYTLLYTPHIRLSIPQRGVLRSYNVSSAMSIVVWEWSRILINRE